MDSAIEWLDPWWSLAEQKPLLLALVAELRRELGHGHVLYGMPVRALAKHHACDDVLFELLDGSGRVAVVHLTWTRNPPEAPPWPGTEFYNDLRTWAEQCMLPEHEEYRE